MTNYLTRGIQLICTDWCTIEPTISKNKHSIKKLILFQLYLHWYYHQKDSGFLIDQIYIRKYLRISRTINNRSTTDINVPHDMIIIRKRKLENECFKYFTSSGILIVIIFEDSCFFLSEINLKTKFEMVNSKSRKSLFCFVYLLFLFLHVLHRIHEHEDNVSCY